MKLTKAHFTALDEAQLAMLRVLMRRYPQPAKSLAFTCVAADGFSCSVRVTARSITAASKGGL